MHRARQHAASQTRERRHRLAHEAARLMAEGGIRDYHQAVEGRQPARHPRRCLPPRNTEIEDALREYQRLFAGPSTAANQRRREAAMRALEFLHGFAHGWPARCWKAPPMPTARCSFTCTATTRKPCTASWTNTAFPQNRGRVGCAWTANGAWTCRCGCSVPRN